MTKIFRHSGILSMLVIGIIAIVGYFFFANRGNTEVKHIMLSLLLLSFLGICIVAIFKGIKNARSVYDKVLTGLIGNILLNVLFIAALYLVLLVLL